MKIYQKKLNENRQDSFWYEGTIASRGNLTLVATGEIEVSLNGEEIDDPVRYALDNNWTDEDLSKLEFSMNNWFEIYNENDGEGFVCSGGYSEAINDLKNYK